MPKKAKASNGPSRSPEEAEQFRNDKEAEAVELLTALMQQRADISEQMSEVKQQAKDDGLNVKLLMTVAKLALETPEQREDRRALDEAVQELAIRRGLLADMPLGQAARERAGDPAAH